MKGDSDTTLAEFFSAWNSDLPEPIASENIDIQNLFLRRHRRTRFSNWFQLTTRVLLRRSNLRPDHRRRNCSPDKNFIRS